MKKNTNFTKEQEIAYMFKSMLNGSLKSEEWWSFIKDIDPVFLKRITKSIYDAEERLNNYKHSSLFVNKIRKYVNLHLYSDIKPYEVIRVISSKCVEVRELDTIQLTHPSNFQIGGFVAHCVDSHNQSYEYISNENNLIFRIRLSKKGWGNGKFIMSDEPIKFYDYNF